MPIDDIYKAARALGDTRFCGQQNRFSILHTPVLNPLILLVGNRPAQSAAPGLDEEAGTPNENLLFSDIPYMFVARAFFNDIGQHDVLNRVQSTFESQTKLVVIEVQSRDTVMIFLPQNEF